MAEPKETRITLARVGAIDPERIDDAINAGGYQALRSALGTDRGKIIDELISASLRGRGRWLIPTCPLPLMRGRWLPAHRAGMRRGSRSNRVTGIVPLEGALSRKPTPGRGQVPQRLMQLGQGVGPKVSSPAHAGEVVCSCCCRAEGAPGDLAPRPARPLKEVGPPIGGKVGGRGAEQRGSPPIQDPGDTQSTNEN